MSTGWKKPVKVKIWVTVYVALTEAAVLPALSEAPAQVAVNVPVPFGLPPVTVSDAAAPTPERASVVEQPAVGTEP